MRYFKYHRNIYKRCIALLFSILSLSVVLAQSGQAHLNGVVKDNKGNLLSGVIITIQESTITTISGETGEYSIRAITGDNLSFSLPGYQTISKVVEQNTTRLDIILPVLEFGKTEQDNVPVAYSSKNKRDLISSISMTKFEEFGKRKDMNTMNGLGGLINGLVVLSSGWSDTGVGTSFYVRGLKTTSSNNSPLILVDDVERTFDQMNANEIESVSVLKDAAALAIYG
ncbi:MAG TPA: TonB-dependent receptor plug domain-containing protein, partial [Paludibacter sp.]|nr:TonB-dependent receptor plug domain-containing protein [Paludibacter sp.]